MALVAWQASTPMPAGVKCVVVAKGADTAALGGDTVDIPTNCGPRLVATSGGLAGSTGWDFNG